MVKTGYISFIVETGGGQDGEGNPIASNKVPSAYIECNLAVVKKEYKTIVDGQYQQASYSCYIDTAKVLNTIDLNTIKEVQVQDNNTNYLGVFQVQNIEYLNLSKRVKLVV